MQKIYWRNGAETQFMQDTVKLSEKNSCKKVLYHFDIIKFSMVSHNLVRETHQWKTQSSLVFPKPSKMSSQNQKCYVSTTELLHKPEQNLFAIGQQE